MNWLKRRLRNWLNDDRIGCEVLSTRDHLDLQEERHNPMRFTVYKAQGGKVVEVKTYDDKRDRWEAELYVIENTDNFGESIGKIVFTESLKRGF